MCARHTAINAAIQKSDKGHAKGKNGGKGNVAKGRGKALGKGGKGKGGHKLGRLVTEVFLPLQSSRPHTREPGGIWTKQGQELVGSARSLGQAASFTLFHL